VPDSVGIFRHRLFLPTETFIRSQADALQTFSPVFISRRAISNKPAGIRAVTLSDIHSPVSDFVYGIKGSSTSLRDIFRRERLALVHAHFGPDGMYAAKAARAASIPLIVTLHGRDVTVSKKALMATLKPVAFNYALNRARLGASSDRIICVSEQIRTMALNLGLPESKLVTHHIGVDTKLYNKRPWPREKTIVHVARLVEKKGTTYLLAAYARIASQHRDSQLYIIGDGPLRAKLESEAESLGIAAQVTFCGTQPEDEVRARVGHARIFALPSVEASNGDREGLPIALIEAMSLGTSIIATRHSGIPEAVVSDSVGMLVAEKDTLALAGSLDYLLSNESAAQQLGEAAARHVRLHLNLRTQTQILETIYRAAITGRMERL
jgi:colanic acid/amylovoran biosynthesis glycosyltransferase